MQVLIITSVVCFCGGDGGFVNALLAGDLHLPHREAGNLYSPGGSETSSLEQLPRSCSGAYTVRWRRLR